MIMRNVNPKSIKDDNPIYKRLNLGAIDLKKDELYYRSKNDSSIGFYTGAFDKTREFFRNKFDLEPDRFKEKFLEAISGDGSEFIKIDTLHSSSLCALLCFYNVNKNNPLFFENVKYTDVFFEVKNKAPKTPSNMDVVLTDINENSENSILFVECKFSEYLESSNTTLGKEYNKDPYKRIFDAFNYDEKKGYKYGLKQIVTHYIGICNFAAKNCESYNTPCFEGDRRPDIYNKTFKNISFVEVIFEPEKDNKKDNKKYKDKYEVYINNAKEVIEKLNNKDIVKNLQNEIIEESRKSNSKNVIKSININLYDPKTYQELFSGENSNVLNDTVAKFYQLGKYLPK